MVFALACDKESTNCYIIEGASVSSQVIVFHFTIFVHPLLMYCVNGFARHLMFHNRRSLQGTRLDLDTRIVI